MRRGLIYILKTSQTNRNLPYFFFISRNDLMLALDHRVRHGIHAPRAFLLTNFELMTTSSVGREQQLILLADAEFELFQNGIQV